MAEQYNGITKPVLLFGKENGTNVPQPFLQPAYGPWSSLEEAQSKLVEAFGSISVIPVAYTFCIINSEGKPEEYWFTQKGNWSSVEKKCKASDSPSPTPGPEPEPTPSQTFHTLSFGTFNPPEAVALVTYGTVSMRVNSNGSCSIPEGTAVSVTISCSGYVPQEIPQFLMNNGDVNLGNITLSPTAQNCALTIVGINPPSLEDVSLSITYLGNVGQPISVGDSLTLPKGTSVKITGSAKGANGSTDRYTCSYESVISDTTNLTLTMTKVEDTSTTCTLRVLANPNTATFTVANTYISYGTVERRQIFINTPVTDLPLGTQVHIWAEKSGYTCEPVDVTLLQETTTVTLTFIEIPEEPEVDQPLTVFISPSEVPAQVILGSNGVTQRVNSGTTVTFPYGVLVTIDADTPVQGWDREWVPFTVTMDRPREYTLNYVESQVPPPPTEHTYTVRITPAASANGTVATFKNRQEETIATATAGATGVIEQVFPVGTGDVTVYLSKNGYRFIKNGQETNRDTVNIDHNDQEVSFGIEEIPATNKIDIKVHLEDRGNDDICILTPEQAADMGITFEYNNNGVRYVIPYEGVPIDVDHGVALAIYGEKTGYSAKNNNANRIAMLTVEIDRIGNNSVDCYLVEKALSAGEGSVIIVEPYPNPTPDVTIKVNGEPAKFWDVYFFPAGDTVEVTGEKVGFIPYSDSVLMEDGTDKTATIVLTQPLETYRVYLDVTPSNAEVTARYFGNPNPIEGLHDGDNISDIPDGTEITFVTEADGYKGQFDMETIHSTTTKTITLRKLYNVVLYVQDQANPSTELSNVTINATCMEPDVYVSHNIEYSKDGSVLRDIPDGAGLSISVSASGYDTAYRSVTIDESHTDVYINLVGTTYTITVNTDTPGAEIRYSIITQDNHLINTTTLQNGVASQGIPAGTNIMVTTTADGYIGQSVRYLMNQNRTVSMNLEASTPSGPDTYSLTVTSTPTNATIVVSYTDNGQEYSSTISSGGTVTNIPGDATVSITGSANGFATSTIQVAMDNQDQNAIISLFNTKTLTINSITPRVETTVAICDPSDYDYDPDVPNRTIVIGTDRALPYVIDFGNYSKILISAPVTQQYASQYNSYSEVINSASTNLVRNILLPTSVYHDIFVEIINPEDTANVTLYRIAPGSDPNNVVPQTTLINKKRYNYPNPDSSYIGTSANPNTKYRISVPEGTKVWFTAGAQNYEDNPNAPANKRAEYGTQANPIIVTQNIEYKPDLIASANMMWWYNLDFVYTKYNADGSTNSSHLGTSAIENVESVVKVNGISQTIHGAVSLHLDDGDRVESDCTYNAQDRHTYAGVNTGTVTLSNNYTYTVGFSPISSETAHFRKGTISGSGSVSYIRVSSNNGNNWGDIDLREGASGVRTFYKGDTIKIEAQITGGSTISTSVIATAGTHRISVDTDNGTISVD